MKTSASIQSKTFLKNLGLLCAAGMYILSATDTHAAALTWATPGTAGNWADGAGGWLDPSTAPVSWSNATPDSATFGGTTAYIVSLTSPITTAGLTFTNTAGVITLSGGANAITLTNASVNTSGAGGATISAVLGGSVGFTKLGTGQLSLNAVNTYTGATTISAGSVRLAATGAIPTGSALTVSSGATLFVDSKNISVASLSGTGLIRNINSQTSAMTLTINGGSGTVFNGTLSATADTARAINILKTGAGSQTISGVNINYIGTTTVTGGTLKLGDTTAASLNATNSVVVNGGILTSAVGNSNLGLGAVSLSSGSINPGDIGTAATFTLAANQGFTATGGTLNFDLGTSIDQIIGSGTGTFSLTGTTLALNQISGFGYGSTYTLFNGFASGTNSGLSITGYDTVNYAASLSSGGVLSFTAVPEPSTYALLGMGLAGLWFLRRRKTSV